MSLIWEVKILGNGHDPYVYLKEVLTRLPTQKASEIAELLPHNSAGNRGVSISFHADQLPVFSLWKNTDTTRQGYVTGFEPGTSFSYNRRYQRELGLVPIIGPKEERHFQLSFTLLANAADVDQVLQRIDEIQAGRPTEVCKTPLFELREE